MERMVVVVFRSRLSGEAEAEYETTAARMETLASEQPGFISIKTFAAADGERVTIAEFESEESAAAWKRNGEHRAAQARGRESFYSEYRLQVCEPIRDYGFEREKDAGSGA